MNEEKLREMAIMCESQILGALAHGEDMGSGEIIGPVMIVLKCAYELGKQEALEKQTEPFKEGAD